MPHGSSGASLWGKEDFYFQCIFLGGFLRRACRACDYSHVCSHLVFSTASLIRQTSQTYQMLLYSYLEAPTLIFQYRVYLGIGSSFSAYNHDHISNCVLYRYSNLVNVYFIWNFNMYLLSTLFCQDFFSCFVKNLCCKKFHEFL